MSGLANTILKAVPKEIDPAAHALGSAVGVKAARKIESSVGLHKQGPVTLLQPTPNDPNVLNNQQRQAALAAQRSGRAATILSDPSSDSLGG